jgi:hypothetical protein
MTRLTTYPLVPTTRNCASCTQLCERARARPTRVREKAVAQGKANCARERNERQHDASPSTRKMSGSSRPSGVAGHTRGANTGYSAVTSNLLSEQLSRCLPLSESVFMGRGTARWRRDRALLPAGGGQYGLVDNCTDGALKGPQGARGHRPVSASLPDPCEETPVGASVIPVESEARWH